MFMPICCAVLCSSKDDFIYADELQQYEKSGVLSQLHVAFSRDGPSKVCTTRSLREEVQIGGGGLSQHGAKCSCVALGVVARRHFPLWSRFGVNARTFSPAQLANARRWLECQGLGSPPTITVLLLYCTVLYCTVLMPHCLTFALKSPPPPMCRCMSRI
jgi:hypothetical protein